MLLKDFVSPVHHRRRSRLDRFQRIVDQRWINGSNVDRFKYGYDRNGNRTYKENGVNASLSEVYTNDNLNQLASYKLGTLNGGKSRVGEGRPPPITSPLVTPDMRISRIRRSQIPLATSVRGGK